MNCINLWRIHFKPNILRESCLDFENAKELNSNQLRMIAKAIISKNSELYVIFKVLNEFPASRATTKNFSANKISYMQ